MQPATICNTFLGASKIAELLANLSSPQLKAILRNGGVRAKLPGGLITQQKRKKTWIARIVDSISGDNDDTANEFIQQWLLNYRRQMLIDYLESLGISHTSGETDTSFLLSTDPDKVRRCAASLTEAYPADEAATYLAYVALQQKSTVFDDWDRFGELALTKQPRSADEGSEQSPPVP